MFEGLKRWFAPAGAATAEERRHRASVAAVAILQELALADGQAVPAEVEAITRAMCRHFGFGPEVAAELQALAEAARDTRGDLASLARTVRDGWSSDEKRSVLEAMREVIWADGVLEGHEERLAASVASLLGLEPGVVKDVLLPPEA